MISSTEALKKHCNDPTIGLLSWGGGQGLDLKMEADHDWSPDMILQGCASTVKKEGYKMVFPVAY